MLFFVYYGILQVSMFASKNPVTEDPSNSVQSVKFAQNRILNLYQLPFSWKPVIITPKFGLLKHIIYDWDDLECVQILSNMKATNPKATVFVMEFGPMPGPNTPHLSKIFDLHTALFNNGRELTQDEYNSLFERTGYEVSQTHALAGGNHPLYIQEIVLKE